VRLADRFGDGEPPRLDLAHALELECKLVVHAVDPIAGEQTRPRPLGALGDPALELLRRGLPSG
jgi:hypothetical protein